MENTLEKVETRGKEPGKKDILEMDVLCFWSLY